MRTPILVLSCALITSLQAQLLNGSFEDELGNPTLAGWVGTCDVMPGPGAPGFGSYSILVLHSNAPGCGWSRLDQLVPFIGDGETCTLSGWVSNLTFFFADPSSPRHNDDLDPARRTIVVCASGARASLAALTLETMGYEDVVVLDGGFKGWTDAGLPTTEHEYAGI